MYDLLSVCLLESCCFKKLIPVFTAGDSCEKKLIRVLIARYSRLKKFIPVFTGGFLFKEIDSCVYSNFLICFDANISEASSSICYFTYICSLSDSLFSPRTP
jgi:hypothetical protein